MNNKTLKTFDTILQITDDKKEANKAANEHISSLFLSLVGEKSQNSKAEIDGIKQAYKRWEMNESARKAYDTGIRDVSEQLDLEF